MFGHIDRSKGYLFSTTDLSGNLESTVNALRQEVEGLDANRLLNTAPADLVTYLVERYSVEPLRLKKYIF